MEMGADGIFIDCAGITYDCYGQAFGIHDHGNDTNGDMFLKLHEKIYKLVKSYGEDKIVVHNACLDGSRWPWADAIMWESCVYTNTSEKPFQTWEELQHGAAFSEDAAKHGKRVLALSYLNGHPLETRFERAIYAYTFARIHDMLWSDYFSLLHIDGVNVALDNKYSQCEEGIKFARDLYSIRLGKPIGQKKTAGSVVYREFEHGFAVMNLEKKPESLSLPAPRECILIDVLRDRKLQQKSGAVQLELGPESAAILVRQSNTER